MAAETQYTANTGIVQVSTANSNLDGTGTLETVITAAANGTDIRSIVVKAIADTNEGMVRFFLNDGTNKRLLYEVDVPKNTYSATNPAFEYVWNCDVKLKSGWSLMASTQNAETFNIIAEGLDWNYYASSVRFESTNYTANNGTALIDTANPNLDGTGSIEPILTGASVAAGFKGTQINKVVIKALGATVNSMVRLFIRNNAGDTRLFREIQIPGTRQSGTQNSFSTELSLNDFNLQAGYIIYASTETNQSFSVTAQGSDWKYPS